MMLPRQGIVPQGQMKIAQRFSVGLDALGEFRPEGTAETVSNFQSSLRDEQPRALRSKAKALGCFQTSQRDVLAYQITIGAQI
jgi:hypothetical protein